MSQGRAPVKVPDVVGLAPEKATANLEELGFTVKRTANGRSADVQTGEVMSMNPNPAGGAVPYGSTVTIRVSEGVPIVTVPDLQGRKQQEAAKALTKLGLKVDATPFGPGNRVIVTNPPAGAQVEVGTTVQLALA